MKTHFHFAAILVIAATTGFVSCKKDEVTPPADDHHSGTGSLRVNFTPMFGDSLLDLNTESYVTGNGDTLTVSLFKFYVSNVILTDDEGNIHAVPESYFLIDAQTSTSETITLNDIPGGHYTTISFLIGVDSTRNVSGSQTGALDPANAMFWTWNSGYIMAKLEGTSPQSTQSFHAVTYHIGGFSGTNNAIRSVTIPLTTNASVTSTGNPLVTLKADVAEWFVAPDTIDIAINAYAMMPSAFSVQIANNYSDMFSLVSVQN